MGHMYAILVEVKGQLWGVSFVLPLCGLWEPNSSLQPWQQAPLPTVTSPATIISCFILNGVALTGLELVDQAVL